MKIYVDMDGVLCDFEKRYKELYGNISDKDRRSTFKPNFADFIATEGGRSPENDAWGLV